MAHSITSKENITLSIIFEWIGESPINRTMEEYVAIAEGLPKFEAMYAYVNATLKRWAEAGYAPYQICYFKAGDRYPWYEDFPTWLSKSTVRNALVKAGFWDLRRRPSR